MITGRQIKEARKLLGWTLYQLAERTNLSLDTLVRAEGVEGEAPVTIARAAKIQGVFEAAGIEFLSLNGEGPSLRLKARTNPRNQ